MVDFQTLILSTYALVVLHDWNNSFNTCSFQPTLYFFHFKKLCWRKTHKIWRWCDPFDLPNTTLVYPYYNMNLTFVEKKIEIVTENNNIINMSRAIWTARLASPFDVVHSVLKMKKKYCKKIHVYKIRFTKPPKKQRKTGFS